MPAGIHRGRIHIALLATALSTLTILSGCASTASRLPTPYQVMLQASDDVNPDSRERPSPVQVTLYELKSEAALDNTDFFTLQADPQAALGDDLLAVEQFILGPGQERNIRRAGSVDARALAVVAAYRDLERSQWRLVVPLPDPKNTNIYKIWQFTPGEKTIGISIGRDRVSLRTPQD